MPVAGRVSEEAEFERARLALEASRAPGPLVTVAAPTAPDAVEPSLTVAGFWETYLADARSRLARSTVESYKGDYRRRVQPRFGELRLSEIRPRAVSQWRAAMLAEATGPEFARRAKVLLQAMFTVAVGWGEVESNPVALVRKPRQGCRSQLRRSRSWVGVTTRRSVGASRRCRSTEVRRSARALRASATRKSSLGSAVTAGA